MLDIGWQELFIVGILAILVIGPKDLPRALRTVMNAIKKLRGISREFQSGVDEMVREADLDDLKKELNKVKDGDLKKRLSDAVDPDGDLKKELDMKDVQQDLDKIAKDATKEDPVPATESKPTESKPTETKKTETIFTDATKSSDNTDASDKSTSTT